MFYYLLILLGLITRIIPHLPNFTSIGAIALFSGYSLKNKKTALILPLSIMFLTDIKLGLYQWQLMFFVYLSFLCVVGLGMAIKNKKWYFSVPTSIVGSLIFFVVTNWSFWQFTNFYPHNFGGLIQTYIAGIPFFKNSLISDLLYTSGIFAIAEISRILLSNSKLCSKNPPLSRLALKQQ